MTKLNIPVTKNKADWLLKLDGVRMTQIPFVARFGEHVLVCVQENGSFDAAWMPTDQNEVRDVIQYDPRPRTWLEVPKSVIDKLAQNSVIVGQI